MQLSELIKLLPGIDTTPSDVDITGITYDSRAVRQGFLFVAFQGGTFDGHDYISAAVEQGAAAVMAEREISANVPVIVVPNGRSALPVLSARFYNYPSRGMTLIGVTGTNGKTTTTQFIQSIFRAAGKKSAFLGTLGASVDDRIIETGHTTPESSDLQSVLADMLSEGVQALAMEVSSHALVQGRSDLSEFDCGVFTNLTQDHLDFHITLDEYLKAKLKFFSEYPKASSKPFVAAVNIDDPAGEKVAQATAGRVVTYGINKSADVRGSDIEVTPSSVSLVISSEGESVRVNVPMGGYFNAYNSLAAAAACLGLGIDLTTIASGLENTSKVAGRFESVDCGQSFGVIVDYAHTPDGLENVLSTARELSKRRLIAVFGCGGNRDKGKRPIMGEIASRIADVTIITSDNPRKEDPESIIRDILAGVPLNAKPEAIVDRREAIEYAIRIAEPDDVVVIAGKGHEDYQIFADCTIHFDDREVAREALQARKQSEACGEQ